MWKWKPDLDGLKCELRTLVAALRHPATPWYAKAVAFLVVAYAVSPIDLIPDPIPVLGLLDDALLIPLGVLVVRRLIPADVLAECRRQPASATARVERIGALLVAANWVMALLALWIWLR